MNEDKKLKVGYLLKAHSDWVTSISVAVNDPKIFISGSRDCLILLWDILYQKDLFAVIKKRLIGHSHFISELILSVDGKFCFSSSWDKTIRLWDLSSYKTIRKFLGHKKDVLSISFSSDNRLIASGSRDKTVKLWNTLGECKNSFLEQKTSSWVSCVKFLPTEEPIILSCYWDGTIKMWNIPSKKVKSKLNGHKGFINCVAVSPDGSLCASGGKDTIVMLWDLNEEKHLYSLEGGDIIHSLCFSPNRYWLCASTLKGIRIWDLESKMLVEELYLNNQSSEFFKKECSCISMAWTTDGSFFLTG
jgi:guanine nucleotide-binding protein subunit beta-2-like 1 protein